MNLDKLRKITWISNISKLPDKIVHLDGLMISRILKLSFFLTGRLNFAYGFGILEEICFYVGILS